MSPACVINKKNLKKNFNEETRKCIQNISLIL